MTIRGKKEGAAALCTGLTDRDFLMLARDILVMRGHRGIRVMDGPGDGMRDIHSFTSEGMLHVTQVAHARKASTTVRGRKMSELPAAMVKFGAKHGLFITSGNISPQAKREFLGDYPKFELDFVDGDALADEILRQVPLKALWYDGVEFGRVSNRVRLPFLLRDLATDRPVSLTKQIAGASWPTMTEDVQITCEQQWVHASAFKPYRQPQVAGLFEGISSQVRVHEFVCSGVISIDELRRNVDALVKQVFQRVRRICGTRLLALRFGQAVLVPLQGDWSGASIQVGQRPFTMLLANGEIIDEWAWLADVDDHWLRATVLRNVNANWLRRFDAELNLCFAVELVTTATEDSLLQTAAMTRLTMRDWDSSVFCLLDPRQESGLAGLPAQPTHRHTWADGRLFLAWRFREFAGPFATLARADGADILGLQTKEDRIRSELALLRDSVAAIGGDIVEPRVARHMTALFEPDPFPTEEMAYRFVDLEREREYPSPLDPRGRSLSLDVCWRLAAEPDDAREAELVSCIAAWSAECAISKDAYFFEFDQTDRTSPSSWFVRLQLLQRNGDPLVSTRERLRAFVADAEPQLQNLEVMFRQREIVAVRATREYWDVLCEMDFREPTPPQKRRRVKKS